MLETHTNISECAAKLAIVMCLDISGSMAG